MFRWEENFNYPNGSIFGVGGWGAIDTYDPLQILDTRASKSTNTQNGSRQSGANLTGFNKSAPWMLTGICGFTQIDGGEIHFEASVGNEGQVNVGVLLIYLAGGLATHTCHFRIFVAEGNGANGPDFTLDPTGPITVTLEYDGVGSVTAKANGANAYTRSTDASLIQSNTVELYQDTRNLGDEENTRWCAQLILENTGNTPANVVNVASPMYISQARKITRFSARNAGDTGFYPTLELDFAIRRAADELIRRAHLLLRIDTVDTVAGTDVYTSELPTAFRTDRLDSAWLSGANVVVDQSQLWNGSYPDTPADFTVGGPQYVWQRNGTSRLTRVSNITVSDFAISTGNSGQPYLIGFKLDTSYQIFPNPDKVYTANFRWSDFITTWVIGSALVSVTISGGAVSAVSVVDSGDSLGNSITASFVGGGGTGATCACTVTNGKLVSVIVTAGGSGYTSAPDFQVNGYSWVDQQLNLPGDLLNEVLSLGAPAFLQYNDPQHAYATEKGKLFDQYIERYVGAVGGTGIESASPRRRR